MHKKEQYKDLLTSDTEVLEYRYPKRSWLLRVWFEYIHLYFISKKIDADFWFSIHDMTPNVKCNYQAVYCHNPAPFYKLSFKEAMMNKSLIFFRYFYSFFYRINIHRNRYVIVQQDCLRKEFKKKYHLKNIVVAYPDVSLNINSQQTTEGNFIFFYPSLPRTYKNFEVLLEAGKKLSALTNNFEIIITIDGTENAYSKHLKENYGNVPQIKFTGILSREKVFDIYAKNTCLVFPSKLETWGLPITEMKLFHKPVLAANCNYAHETVGNYDKVVFFDPGNAEELVQLMYKVMDNAIVFDKTNFTEPAAPFTKNWKELFQLLLN